MKKLLCLLSLAVLCSFSAPASGQDAGERLNILENSLKSQSILIEEQKRALGALKEEIERRKEIQAGQAALDGKSPSGTGGFFGASMLTNPNISLSADAFVYGSTLDDGELESRGIPGFTALGKDARNGFNMGAAEDGAELFVFAPVDPYFNLYVNLPFSDQGVALEEAFAVTTALPEGLQVKLGKFKSNFSRLNAQHPHAWDFFDIALPYRAFLGNEGTGGEKGMQLTWLPSLPFYTQLGAELLQGENDLLFGAPARSGPHAFSFFVKGSFDLADDSTLYFGPSVLLGKTRNSSIVADAEVDGRSALYGLEALWKWKPSRRAGVTIQGEYLFLTQSGDVTDAVAQTVESLRRRQDGFYLQGIYQLGRWRFGARYDMLELFADTFRRADLQQELGATPWRATGSVEFNPSEFTRIRLQYNHDRTGRDGRSNDEAILQFIFGIGAHAAHSF